MKGDTPDDQSLHGLVKFGSSVSEKIFKYLFLYQNHIFIKNPQKRKIFRHAAWLVGSSDILLKVDTLRMIQINFVPVFSDRGFLKWLTTDGQVFKLFMLFGHF